MTVFMKRETIIPKSEECFNANEAMESQNGKMANPNPGSSAFRVAALPSELIPVDFSHSDFLNTEELLLKLNSLLKVGLVNVTHKPVRIEMWFHKHEVIYAVAAPFKIMSGYKKASDPRKYVRKRIAKW